MLRLLLFFLFLNATVLAMGQGSDNQQRFVVSLPPQWQESKLRIVVEGLQAPGNVPFKLRVTVKGDDEKEIALGSLPVEAIGPGKSAPRTLKSLRIDVTRTLNRYLENKSNPSKVELLIRPVDARNTPLKNLEWSVKEVRLETQPK